MRVRAKQLGFFGGRRRREGEVFEIPAELPVTTDGVTEMRPFKPARWMEPIADDAPAEPVAAEPPHAGPDGRPVTVSLKGRVGKPTALKPKAEPSSEPRGGDGEPKADA